MPRDEDGFDLEATMGFIADLTMTLEREVGDDVSDLSDPAREVLHEVIAEYWHDAPEILEVLQGALNVAPEHFGSVWDKQLKPEMSRETVMTLTSIMVALDKAKEIRARFKEQGDASEGDQHG